MDFMLQPFFTSQPITYAEKITVDLYWNINEIQTHTKTSIKHVNVCVRVVTVFPRQQTEQALMKVLETIKPTLEKVRQESQDKTEL